MNGDFDTHFIEKLIFTDPSVLDKSCEKEAEIAALTKLRHLQKQTLSLKTFGAQS